MGVAVIPARLCAVNPDHGAATRRVPIGHRCYDVCRACANPEIIDVPVVDDGAFIPSAKGRHMTPMRDEVLRVVRFSPGITGDDLGDAIVGERDGDLELRHRRNALSALVRRMTVEGFLRRERCVRPGVRGLAYQIWIAGVTS